jgi:hypothetical protein
MSSPARLLIAAALAASMAPAAARAGAPAAGETQVLRSGFFADVNLGAFATAGGRDAAGQSTLSSPQAYLQLGLGYDLSRRFSVGASFGLGASAASCFAVVKGGACVFDGARAASADNAAADNFTVSLFTLQASYRLLFTERLSLQPRLHAGLAALDPAPRRNSASGVSWGFAAGGGLGVEYATRLDHITLGADLSARWVTGAQILALAVYPKVKYTF